MKRLHTPTACLILAFAALTSGCQPSPEQSIGGSSHRAGRLPDEGPQKGMVFFLAPDRDAERTKQVKQAFFGALERAEEGTRWHIFTSVDHKHLVSFDVPSATGRKRFRELRSILPLIHKAFDQVDRDADGQVNLPAIPASVRGQLTTETECRVAIYGSPRYLNPDQNAFEHNGVYVTKDGSVDHELSPFQTEPKLPGGTSIAWVTPQNRYGYDEKHKGAIRHFNGYFLQQAGGTLLRTTEDANLLFDFSTPATAQQYPMKHHSAGKYAATVKTVGEGDEEIETVQFDDENVMAPSGAEDSPESILTSAEHDKGTIALAINWYSEDPSCDIDMRLSSNGLPGELSYQTSTTTWGKHYRDVTSASAEQAQVDDYQNWEWISVDHARLHDLVLYLNVYRTTAPARVTIVRVWNGERKVRVIDLNVTEGDQGAYRNNRRASEAWRRVSLYSIVDTDQLGGN